MVTRIFSETNKPEGNSTEKSPSQNQCLSLKKKHEDKIFLISWQLAFKSSKTTVWNAKFCNAKNSNWFNLMKHQLFSLKTKFPKHSLIWPYLPLVRKIKLNELVIAQSISICLAEVYISIPVHTKLDRQWGKTTNYWSIDINDRKWVAQTKPSTFYFSSLSWPLFNLDN